MFISTGFRSGCSTDPQLVNKYIDFKFIRIDCNFGLSVYLEKYGGFMDQKAVYLYKISTNPSIIVFNWSFLESGTKRGTRK